MKQTIKLTESDLRNLIREALKEVKYGGVEFHGTNPEDWAAMRNLRVYSPVNLKSYDKAKRNFSKLKDFFDKNWGEYEVEKGKGHYQYPNENEYNKAEDWLSNKHEVGFEKGNQALDGAREMKKEKGVQILQKLVSNHQPFYTKKWQQNGYFPITKWEYDEEGDEYTSTWGHHVGHIPLDDVMYAASCDDLFTPEEFSNEHCYEEDGVVTYPIYKARVRNQSLDNTKLDEGITRAIRKLLR